MVPANPVIGVRVGHADKSHLLGSFRLGSARVRLKSESKSLFRMAMANMISIMTDIVDIF